ncbi:hypothetical protein WR25_16915 [Diploscapter pachys]|uniref:NADH:flavin oxidoreductase/NADH oxidase N-terminal domain-containing protein n=1 Tax=Diploscapter pachys TaxID=2018661 RepID=A0A2A2LJV4_9BILA|nr:hypothetical protein WR25_16915 [Diploscapter pachys]
MKRYLGKEVNPSPLFEPLIFKNGVVMKNRFVKGPMSEGLCSWGDDVRTRGYPTKGILNVYEKWSKGGFGMSITGNIMINTHFLEMPGNGVICKENWSDELGELLKKWADSSKHHGCLAIAQLVHCGRQTAVDSSTQLKINSELGIPEYEYVQMSLEEVQTDIIDRFVFAAMKCKEAGFDGVELNSAYGFLLSQFTSAKHNKRTDKYGVNAIREHIPKGNTFLLGIKLNATEFLFDSGAEGVNYAAEMAEYFEELFDLMELSGGTTEPIDRPTSEMPTRFVERLEFFNTLHQKLTSILITCKLFPSGFRTVRGMVDALKDGKADGIPIARAATSEPDLPNKVKSGEVKSILWIKLPPSESRLHVNCSGSQILAMSKNPLVDGMSLSHGIPMFTSEEACKKYLDQLSEFQKAKELRESLVPRYLEFVNN